MTSDHTVQLRHLLRRMAHGVVLGGALACSLQVGAQTALADAPVFATNTVPGNLVLALSVEFPTVINAAHQGGFVAGTRYLGYFDPQKCYRYHVGNETGTDMSHFYPVGATTSTFRCTGSGLTDTWSGSFMNWLTMQSIDPFRWALTGGYRRVDTATTTILERAWASTLIACGNPLAECQGSDTNFPVVGDAARPSPSSTVIAEHTPLSFSSLRVSVRTRGNRIWFTQSATLTTSTSGTPTHYTQGSTPAANSLHYFYARVRVCDTTAGVEANCRPYAGGNYKPEGLLQQYASRIRFSAFGYLNDPTDNIRDGGVLRARQKFVGPQTYTPGTLPTANAATEWDALTGVQFINPDSTDASNTATSLGVTVNNSGVINYLNKFGQEQRTYKRRDPVSELYYGALRYLRNVGHVPAWSNIAGAADRQRLVDGFPVITNWDDPIQYSCQRNFILGIGDTNTNWDRNVPGSSGGSSEPAMPSLVGNDTAFNALTATNRVGVMQGLGASLGTATISNGSYLIAGLAWDANTRDIRPDDVTRPHTLGRQSVSTYWLDVLEFNAYAQNNQYYLAAKYGGFDVPTGFNPDTHTGALTESWWRTTTDTVGGQPRPDNYFTASRPDQVVAGLTAAFSRISQGLEAYTTSFSTSLPQVSISGNGSYSAQYDPNNWTGEVQASELSFNAVGDPTLTPRWTATAQLASQLAGTGWNTNRNVVSWSGTAGVAFRATGASRLTDPQLATLNTTYDTADDRVNYLNYLRGDRTHESNSTATGSTRAYRTRANLLGDIVGSRARPVGPPALPLSDATNPGYDAFKTEWRTRPTVVYVGANDGMLHAFDGNLNTAAGGGREIFAYVPSALFNGPNNTPGTDGLASLGRSPLAHRYFVNATPTVFDVDLGRTMDGGAVGTTTNWRSVLIGGLGKGGRSYYAIDVTNPAGITNETSAASRVLWEFTAPEMGFTFGEPMVVKTRKYGWTVILPSGYNTPDGVGRLFFVNPRNGQLLETVSTGAGGASNDAGFAHANAYVVDFTDGYADAVYGGDLLGNLWRFDITAESGTYPTPTLLATLSHPIDGAQPVTSRPIMELHPRTRARTVMVGTGRLLDTSDVSSTRMQSFYAIEDGNAAHFNRDVHLPAGVDFPIGRNELVANTNFLVGFTGTEDAPMGWYFDLGRNPANNVGWRVVSDPTSFFGTVAFAPTLPNADVCSPSGISRIYGADYATGISRLLDNGAVAPYISGGVGVVTDLRFLSVGGQVRLIGGTDRGDVRRVPGEFGSTIGLRRLNWRELPLVN